MKSKKLISFLGAILCFGMLLTSCGKPKGHECHHVCENCGRCTDETCDDPACADKCICQSGPTTRTKYLITNDVGDYGGSKDKTKYGEGAPKNGELDHTDTEYYQIIDYYNLKCSPTRTLLPEFHGYQQTMQDSDGLSCLLMILNYDGFDVVEQYSEEKLVEKQESLTNKPVYKNGSSATELSNVLATIGYQSTANPEVPKNSAAWMKQQLKNNKYVMVRYQDGTRYSWHLVIGIDECDPSVTTDDVIIFADPFDASDHYQDGYAVYHYARFEHWWLHKLIDGNNKEEKECLIVNSKKEFVFETDEKDLMVGIDHYPEKHLLLNGDGTTGGSYGDGRYSGNQGQKGYLPDEIQPGEHPNYYYYKTPDVFNMRDSETREICTYYRPFRQTMASSCGISSVMMCLNYYEFDWSRIGEFITAEDRLGFVGYSSTNKKFGGVDRDDNDRKQEAIVLIYCQYDTYFDGKTGKSFYNYGGVGSGNLRNVPEKLGFTEVEYGRYYRNNFDANKIPFKTLKSFEDYAISHLINDEPVIISWNPTGGHWETVICIDTMGTESTWDDVVILADSSDGVDHYRDGYNILPLDVMYGTWYNSSGSTNQQYVCFTRNNKNGLLK